MNDRRHVLLPFLALLTLGLVACGEDETAVQEAEEDNEAELLVGETVTIEAEVEEVVVPGIGGAFTMGADETLVLNNSNVDVEDDDVVAVTGEVIEFTILDVEETFGFDFDEDEEALLLDFEEDFAVVADTVEITEEG